MDINQFAFDEKTILRGVRAWVECESPSWDGAAVSRMAALIAGDMRELGAQISIIPGRNGYGDCVFADFDPSDSSPGVLFIGHTDTVHPIGTLEGPLKWREENGRCYGPGLFDMKSGNYIALDAIRLLRASGLNGPLPIRFLLTSDEESGNPTTRALIEDTARAQKYVLVPEGAQPNGNIVSGRYPACRLRIWTHGKPSHALLQREEGKSALAAMAKIVLAIEALNDGERSYTVTHINAGRMVSTVPIESYAEVVCSAKSQEALDLAVLAVRNLASEIPGCQLEVKIKTSRPLWTPTPADKALWDQAHKLSREIGFALSCDMLSGGSDGNFTGAIGVPTLDGLGPVGADAHQLTENIEIASLVPRARLLAGLLLTLA